MTDRVPRSRALWALAALCALGVLVIYLLAVRTEIGQRLDDAAVAGRSVVPDDFVADAWTILDGIGVTMLVGAVFVLAVISVSRGRPQVAAAVTIAIGGANVTTQVLKRVLLERPDLGLVTDVNTLPSGHATVAASVTFGLILVTAPRWRAWAALAASIYVAAVGTATVTAGWHRPSDAIAGVFVAGAWTAAAAVLGGDDGGDAGAFPVSLLWIGGIVTALVGMASGVAWVGLRVLGEVTGGSTFDGLKRALLHLTAGTVVALCAIAVSGALVAALSRTEAPASLRVP